MASVTSGEVGNAFGIQIPRSVLQKANLREGDAVVFEVTMPGVIVVRAARTQPVLGDLVAGITPRNRHRETDWGKPRGDEV
jgi:antitoxin MazE